MKRHTFYHNPDIEQYKEKYKMELGYGMSSTTYTPDIHLLIKNLKPESILDYGCGNSGLVDRLKEVYPEIDFVRYDPALEKYNALPIQVFDLIVCMDVLEHIKEKYLYALLQYLTNISKHIFFTISLAPAFHKLPNGDNCHPTLFTSDKWIEILKEYFDEVVDVEYAKNILICVTKNNE